MLEERGVEFDAIEYLRHPLDRTTLESILHLLDGPAAALVRRDATFEELDVDPARLVAAADVVDLLLEHPTLMQRPIGVRGGRAVIARPAELILDLLDG
ncbi:MAG TPA: arsenate reductase [Acidimicrobiia bacterium]|nr:arsenate reductase [Acidimicrobiia bacterium]HIL48340.1 arsenate reductase [Acidimicrobiia bacterium]